MIAIPTTQSAQAPGGAPFIVDQCPFHPGEQIDFAMLEIAEDKLVNWPMVYILANKDSAYVGQTTSVVSRMSQHGANEEKKDFKTVNVIYNEEFNSSVVTDYEHRLIGYMHADGRYKLTNKNDGMTDTNYFSKNVYAHMFEELWEELRRLELAEHTISQIEESEVFKYSPFKGLTADQRVALGKILVAIQNGLEAAQPIVVEGMPGTGKTVLAVYLLKMLKDDPRYKDLNIRLLEPIESLRKTLQASVEKVSGLDKSCIIGSTDLAKPEYGCSGKGKCFDIVLVDEAHRLKRRKNLANYGYFDKTNKKLGLEEDASQLDWVLSQTKLPIFFYDPLQNVGPGCMDRESIERELGVAVLEPIRLESQMRVKGGSGYLRYIQNVLEGAQVQPESFGEYDLVLHSDFSGFVDSFEQTFQGHSLTRMLAGYAWKWASKKDRSVFDIAIDGKELRWNRTTVNWVGKGVDNLEIAHEVGCIHTIQGYDLSYAYVIIGGDLRLDERGLPESNEEGYFDINGKKTATKEELDRYIKNIYYVLLTRGIYGTHVYVCNPDLREYFARYFPVVG